MDGRTKINLAGRITIPVRLRNKYDLHSKSLADIVGTEGGLLVRKTNFIEDAGGEVDNSHITQSETESATVPKERSQGLEGAEWRVEYLKETDTLRLGQDVVIEQAAEKLRPVLYSMLANLNELDKKAASNETQPTLEDIVRVSPTGEINVSRDFRYRYGLHPNAEVEVSDTGDGLLIRKVADSDDPVDRVTGSLPPGNIVEQLGGTDAYIRWIRGK